LMSPHADQLVTEEEPGRLRCREAGARGFGAVAFSAGDG